MPQSWTELNYYVSVDIRVQKQQLITDESISSPTPTPACAEVRKTSS